MVKKTFPLLCFLFTGCTHETIGEIGGGAAGALIGSQIGGGSGRMVATAVGTLVGTKLGGYLGKEISKAEEARIQEAANIALKNNDSVKWKSERHTFKVRPAKENGQNDQNKKERKVSILMKEDGGEFKEVTVRTRKNADGTYSLLEKD